MLSIITPVKNAAVTLRRLIDSLNAQPFERFEWVVVDCLSDDGTIRMIRESYQGPLTLISEADEGIYDAINKGICQTSFNRYMVIGADDYLLDGAVETIAGDLERREEKILSYSYYADGRQVQLRKDRFANPSFAFEFLYGHSGSAVLDKSLHETYGYYSTDYRLVSDNLFLMRCIESGEPVWLSEIPVSVYSKSGASDSNYRLSAREHYEMAVELNRNRLVHWLIYQGRRVKYGGCRLTGRNPGSVDRNS